MLTGLIKGGGGVGEMLTMGDEGGRGGLDPPFLADIICEQPLTTDTFCHITIKKWSLNCTVTLIKLVIFYFFWLYSHCNVKWISLYEGV